MSDMDRPSAAGGQMGGRQPMNGTGPNPGMGIGAGGPPQGGNAIERNRSILNPTDAAAMVTNGSITPNMTVRDLIEKVFKVPIDAPATQLVEAMKMQGQNKSMLGKVQNIAAQSGGGQPPAGGPSAMNRPQGRPAPPENRGLAGLME